MRQDRIQVFGGQCFANTAATLGCASMRCSASWNA
jgi:hypothetical protein